LVEPQQSAPGEMLISICLTEDNSNIISDIYKVDQKICKLSVHLEPSRHGIGIRYAHAQATPNCAGY